MAARAVSFLVCLSAVLSGVQAATTINDVIGKYERVRGLTRLFSTALCPSSLSFRSLYYDVRDAPASLPAPPRLHVFIEHGETAAAGDTCTSAGHVYAALAGHPFTGNAADVMAAWARGGAGPPAPFGAIGSPELQKNLASNRDWVVGYDFGTRVCGRTALPPGIGYLWIEPSWPVVLGPKGTRVALPSGRKYLLLTFRGRPKSACVYVATATGGTGAWPAAPPKDPTRELAAQLPAPGTPLNGTTPGVNGTLPSLAPDGTLPKPTPEKGKDSVTRTDVIDARPGPRPKASARPTPFPSERPSASDPGNLFGRNGTKGTVTSRTPGLRACFPGAATVEMKGGRRVALRALAVGDHVRVSGGVHSPVHLFSHRLADEVHEFVSLRTTSGHSVELSPGHYIYADGSLRVASGVRKDMQLRLADGGESPVVAIKRVRREGLYAPHTLHGDLAVNGVAVSSYTDALHPAVAHHLLAPLRMLYRARVRVPSFLDDGAPSLARFAVAGPSLV